MAYMVPVKNIHGSSIGPELGSQHPQQVAHLLPVNSALGDANSLLASMSICTQIHVPIHMYTHVHAHI